MSNLREREYRASPLLHPANFPYSEQPNALSAYNICYQEQATGSMLRDSQLIFVRVLGWMLFYALSENILQDLSAAILSCSGNSEKIWGLGKFYVDFWIRTFRKYKGKTSNVSGNISRPFFGTVAAEVEAKLVPYPSSHSVAKDNALIRDGFRCVLTKVCDQTVIRKNAEVRAKHETDPDSKKGATQCVHIICASTNLDIESNQVKTQYAANAWDVLRKFGYDEFLTQLNGTSIHRLSNVMTLDSGWHDEFDTLQLWFEPMDGDPPGSHRYKIGSTDNTAFRQVPRIVVLSDASDGKLEMPSRKYLALHAACAKVANLSGAVEYLDDLDRAQEEGSVLAFDGSSAAVFEHALRDAFGSTSQSDQIISY